uniref:Uncharacterized protein n=1 Tax=Megaselia scalaris TaxID=36166 RepID=T1GLN0_MEGSC
MADDIMTAFPKTRSQSKLLSKLAEWVESIRFGWFLKYIGFPEADNLIDNLVSREILSFAKKNWNQCAIELALLDYFYKHVGNVRNVWGFGNILVRNNIFTKTLRSSFPNRHTFFALRHYKKKHEH